MNWGALRPMCEVRKVNQSVLLPPGLCEGLYGQPTVSLRSPLPWSGISIPAADTEGKVFPLVVVKEELSRALQDTHCCCFCFENLPAPASPGASGHVSMGCHWGCWVRDSRLGPSHGTAQPFTLHSAGRKQFTTAHLAQTHPPIRVCLGKLDRPGLKPGSLETNRGEGETQSKTRPCETKERFPTPDC